MDLQKADYILKNIYKLQGLLGQIIFRDGEVVKPIKVVDGILFENLINNIDVKVKGIYFKEIYNEFMFYCYVNDDYRIIFGPFTYEKVSRYDTVIFIANNSSYKDIVIPTISDGKIKELLFATHGLLVDDYNLTENELFPFKDDHSMEHTKKELVNSIVENIDNEMLHFSYKREKEYFKELIESLKDKEISFDKYRYKLEESFLDVKNGASTLSASNFKDAEYALVCCVTLVSRHAMSAGADEDEVYNLSDVILRKLSEAKSVDEINVLNDRFWIEIKEILLNSKKIDSSPYVEKAKEYIAKNIFKTIRLQTIADNVGVNPSYLSRIFSKEVGKTIVDYIKYEKIKRSCNLLRYSDKGIAEIADYVSLSPQSYYTKVFKQYMNMTPSEYKRTNRDENF